MKILADSPKTQIEIVDRNGCRALDRVGAINSIAGIGGGSQQPSAPEQQVAHQEIATLRSEVQQLASAQSPNQPVTMADVGVGGSGGSQPRVVDNSSELAAANKNPSGTGSGSKQDGSGGKRYERKPVL